MSKTMAYVAVVTSDMTHGRIAVMRAKEDGCYVVPGYVVRLFAETEDIARRLNDRIGVSQEEALTVVQSSLEVSERNRRTIARTRKHGGHA